MGFEFLTGKKHFSCFVVTIQTPEGVFRRIVDEKSFTVGRSEESLLSFPEPNISRVHILVSVKKDQVWLIDQGSANGTFINGQKVLANKLTIVQPTDDVKLGTSEIHLKLEVHEKIFKQEAIANSLLPENEKTNIMDVIQGAHQQAKRLIQQAQEHYDKLIKSAEVKVKNVEQGLLVKQDEIVQAAHAQASHMIQEAKKKSAEVVFESEQKALEATKDVFSKAEELKAQGDTYYQQRLSEAQREADALLSHHVEMGQQMLHQAGVKAQTMTTQIQEAAEAYKQRLMAEADAYKQRASLELDAFKQKTFLEEEKIKEIKKQSAQIVFESEQRALQARRTSSPLLKNLRQKQMLTMRAR
jgi:pSer/pThr/pTyr-binding forkhead associated (FHA) protein